MKDKKKWLFGGILFLLILAIAIVLFFNRNLIDKENVKITISESKIYQKEEIESAIDIVMKKFEDFPATLEEIWYQDDEKLFMEWAENYDAEEAIVLYSNFTTYDTDDMYSQGFGRNLKYEKYQWFLVRNEGESWELKTWGWG